MATITKRGSAYRITVSCGYDISGKQLRETLTWTPDPGMTRRQIEKELNRQAVLFEEAVQCGTTHNGNIRFCDFAELFLTQHVIPNLKAKTAYDYREKLKIINQAIGHIRLKNLKPGHIAAFYANMQESGMRAKETAVAKFDLPAWLKAHNTNMTALSNEKGIPLWPLKQIKLGKPVSRANALAVAAAMGFDADAAFLFSKDMTPLSPGTLHTYHRVLSSVLSRAVKWGYISSNPATGVDLPSLAGRQAAYLDEPDARRLLELLTAEPIKWRALITFDLLSGLRRGELLGLRWDDVDFEAQTIQIRQTSNYIPTKGIYTDTPKNATSNRPLRLSRTAFLLLLDYKQWQDQRQQLMGDQWEDTDGRVFTTDAGGPIFPDSITRWFHGFIQRSGLPKVTVHSLRHTYASLMIADGTPLVVVSHQLGHAQASTTANIYAHVIASAEARAAQTFDKFGDIIVQGAGGSPVDKAQ